MPAIKAPGWCNLSRTVPIKNPTDMAVKKAMIFGLKFIESMPLQHHPLENE
jgi:hypothetical protein